MILLLVLPSSIELVHAFEKHEQIICSLQEENHLHQIDYNCELCHLQIKTFATIPNELFSFIEEKINFKNTKNYQYLFNHTELSFPLRGPPFFNFS